MEYRTIGMTMRLASPLFKWCVTLVLLADLTMSPSGIALLGSPARVKPTQTAKRRPERKSPGPLPSPAGPTTQRKFGRISLTALDLSRPPTEQDLKMAGQLGSPLTPSAAADPAKITDPDQRKKQENENLLFGQAIEKWNQHSYPEAVKLFRQLRDEHPDSPWAGEAELHVGCANQF